MRLRSGTERGKSSERKHQSGGGSSQVSKESAVTPAAGGRQETDGHFYNIRQSKVGRRTRFVSQKTR